MRRSANDDPPLPSEPSPIRVQAPVQSICGVWDFTRSAGYHDHRLAPGGHLLHLLIEGEAEVMIDGRRRRVRAGDIISYHGRSAVRFAAGSHQVRFYSVAFIAPGLVPVPADRRIRAARPRQRRAFAELVALAQAPASPSRSLGMHARLLMILEPWVREMDTADGLWQRAELWLRDRRRFRPGIDELAAAVGASRAALRRACAAATGTTVRGALARLRLAEARALLTGGMAVGETARLLGFRRSQELSRAYARFAGVPPTQDHGRTKIPD